MAFANASSAKGLCLQKTFVKAASGEMKTPATVFLGLEKTHRTQGLESGRGSQI